MFRKIESYVAPILLSYVDKYIKDFKSEDTQLSLWSGSVALHNLELRPDVIQEELNLPFTLSSGHIHELLLQVPWMKLVSEPIVITINTIECVLKLKGENGSEGNNSQRRSRKKEQLEAPGYVQSLVSRIVNNIAFRCHNLILKYVEEDIVVSVNIKHLSWDSVNGEWQPVFSEMTEDDLHMRKLIHLSDLTLCLDKRNAAGKIETYMEPLLYRCEMKLRIDSSYGSLLSSTPNNVRIFVHSPSLEFSLSYQQVPMLMRLYALFLALKYGHLKGNEQSSQDIHRTSITSLTNSSEQNVTEESDPAEYGESWAGWMWSFVQPFPLSGDDADGAGISSRNTPIVLTAINLDQVSFVFKIPEMWSDPVVGYPSGSRKPRFVPVLCLRLGYVTCEAATHGIQRFCFRGGFREMSLRPSSSCPCGLNDTHEENVDCKYLESISSKNDTDASTWPVEYDAQSMVEVMSDEEMLNICPALALSYVYHLTLPETFEDNSSFADCDLEQSNFKEETAMNIAIGPFSLLVCAGLIHRTSAIKCAADVYDYPPYYIPKPLLKLTELPPPTTDDYDALSEFVPKVVIRISMKSPMVSLEVWDHRAPLPGVAQTQQRRKSSNTCPENNQHYFDQMKEVPSILVEANSLEWTISRPMYASRLTYITCQLPDPPAIMFEACHKVHNLTVDNLQCSVIHKQRLKKHSDSSKNQAESLPKHCLATAFITQCNFHIKVKNLLLPEYWIQKPDVLLNDYNLNMESITICGTMAKLLVAHYVLQGVFSKSKVDTSVLLGTTLLRDAINDSGMVHLELSLESLSIRTVYLAEIQTHRIVLNTMRVFAIKPLKEKCLEADAKQVWIISAPENSSPLSLPFVKIVFQLSTNDKFASFLTCKVEECSFVVDPLLCQWLTYKYKDVPLANLSFISHESSPAPAGSKPPNIMKQHSSRSLQEIMNRVGGVSRTSNKQSAGQSSSDRERDYIHGALYNVSQTINRDSNQTVQVSSQSTEKKVPNDSLSDLMSVKFHAWQHVSLYLEVDAVTIYFPTSPISAIDCPTVCDAIYKSVTDNENLENEKILVIRLPSTLMKSSTLKQNLLSFCTHGLPAVLPAHVWNSATTLSYPWQVSMTNLSCHTLAANKTTNEKPGVQKTNILKSVSSNVTISLTPKSASPKQDSNVPAQTQSNVAVAKHSHSKEDPEKEKPLSLASLAACVHIDTGSVILSFNRQQLVLLVSVCHGMGELLQSISQKKQRETVIHKKNSIQENVIYGFKKESIDLDNSSMTDSYLLPNESYHLKGSTPFSSCDELDSGITKDDTDVGKYQIRKTNDGSSETGLVMSAWIQWTVSRFTIKCYTESSTENVEEDARSYLKLSLEVEDIMTSLDIHNEYLKLKTKMATASILHYKRSEKNQAWSLGDFNGVILQGRESEVTTKQNEENCFVNITITRARCSSVHNRWGENTNKFIKNIQEFPNNGFISEAEVSLQSIDLVISLEYLEPYLSAMSPLMMAFSCQSGEVENEALGQTNPAKPNRTFINAEFWDAQRLPLFYFEGHQTRFFFPTKQTAKETVADHDVFILQIEKTIIVPIADNPVCRTPIRPDLYQKAARACTLNIPGSELEDRQCQMLVRGLTIQTAHWGQLQNLLGLEMTADKAVSENPALEWNNLQQNTLLESTLPVMGIVQKMDICLVIALSMFYRSELVCGPSIDFNILTDTSISLSTNQLRSIMDLANMYSAVMKNTKQKTSERSSVSCPYLEFIDADSRQLNSNNLKEEWGHRLDKSSSGSLFEKSAEINTSMLSDRGIFSDVTSTGTYRYHGKRPGNSAVSERISTTKIPSMHYIDIYITIGKVSLSVFECLHHNISPCEVDVKNQKRVFSEFDKEELQTSIPTKPLLYGVLHQPNLFYSTNNYFTKMQISVFSLTLSLGNDELLDNLPTPEDYSLFIFETKSGVTNNETGIPPALFTSRWESNIAKRATLKIDVECPIKLTVTLQRLIKIKKLLELFSSDSCENIVETCKVLPTPERQVDKYEESDDSFKSARMEPNYSNCSFLKATLGYLNTLDVSITQSVLCLKTCEDSKSDMLVSFGSLKQHWTMSARSEKINNTGILEAVMVTLMGDEDASRKILLTPWTLGFEMNMTWEMWNLPTDGPNVDIFIDTDRFMMQFCPEQLLVLQNFVNHYMENRALIQELFTAPEKSSNPTNATEKCIKNENPVNFKSLWDKSDVNEQHYKDDLRAGAFKFVEGMSGFPLPYQVFIHPRGLTWKYPQPRVITRVHSFPVPFKVDADPTGRETNDSVLCVLEYFSDVLNSFQFYAKFYIKADQGVKLELTKFNHSVVLSSMWRVVMLQEDEDKEDHANHKENEMKSFDSSKYATSSKHLRVSKSLPLKVDHQIEVSDFAVDSKTLATCLRIDSYFSPELIPKMELAVNVLAIEFNLFNKCKQVPVSQYLEGVSLFEPDGHLPPPHILLNATFTSTQVQTSMWNKDTAQVKLDTNLTCSVVDNSELSMRRVLYVRGLGARITSGCMEMRAKEVTVILQQLRPLLQFLDQESHPKKDNQCYDCAVSKPEIFLNKYLLCNDTNVTLRIGQVDSDENIMLESRKCHLYSWASVKYKRALRLAVQDGDWQSSKGFQIDSPGLSTLEVKCDADETVPFITVIILVEETKANLRTITLMGRLMIYNVLQHSFDFRLYQKKQNQSQTMASPIFNVKKETRSPSLFIHTSANTTFRIRFAGSDAGWTGDIPLKECPKSNMPWLVKVPVKEEMQYVSVWCRVVTDNTHGRILITICPLYIIKSHLPLNTEIKVQTDNVTALVDCTVVGKGSIHSLTCPGTTATKHLLKFTSNTAVDEDRSVPLHYGLINQATFFTAKQEPVDMEAILANIYQWTNSQDAEGEWPYIFQENDTKWMSSGHQLATEITVRSLSAVPCLDSLVVDLAPWALLGCCTGSSVSLHSSSQQLCMLHHQTVIVPPSCILQEQFFIGITLNTDCFLSCPLTLGEDLLGPYESKPLGLVCLDSSASIPIHTNNGICLLSMSYEIRHNIKILRLSSNYVFINQTEEDVVVIPLVLPLIDNNFLVPPTNVNINSITVPAQKSSNGGLPITQFYLPPGLKAPPHYEDFALYLCFALAKYGNSSVSCPVRVDQNFQRRSVTMKMNNKSMAVLVSWHENRGQKFICIHPDSTPQLLLCNRADTTLIAAQVKLFKDNPQNIQVVQECFMSSWLCTLNPSEDVYYSTPTQAEQFPDIPDSSHQLTPHLAFACLPGDANVAWSAPVNVSTNTLEQFVKLPGYAADIKVTVTSYCHSTIFTIQNVSQVDISASDIRSRLMGNVSMATTQEEDEEDEEQTVAEYKEPLNAEKQQLLGSYYDSKPAANMKSDNQQNIVTPSSLSSLPKPHCSKNDYSLQEIKSQGTTLQNMQCTFIVDFMNITLRSEEELEDHPNNDVVSVTFDYAVLSVDPNPKGLTVAFTSREVQWDNPLYPHGGYDFHVVLISQNPLPSSSGALALRSGRPVKNGCNSSMSFACFGNDNVQTMVKALRSEGMFAFTAQIETWMCSDTTTWGVSELVIHLGPISAYLEDTYTTRLADYMSELLASPGASSCKHITSITVATTSGGEGVNWVTVPEHIFWEAAAIAKPIHLNKLTIKPLNILLSVHTSKLFFIALDHSPLQFAAFERTNILTSSYRLGHVVMMHYLSEVILGAGWVVGSLEILGSPGGLARRVGTGLRDLVREPCRGIMRGPWGFLVGMTHGSASLLKHVTQGTVESVSMVMGSVARNLDRLSLDQEHMQRTERARRVRPDGLGQAVARGLQGLGISLLGAVGGIAHSAILESSGGPGAVAAGLTRGLIGVVTKPLGATADLLALAGQGLLKQAGWDPRPQPRSVLQTGPSVEVQRTPGAVYACRAIDRDTGGDLTVIVTDQWLMVMDMTADRVRDVLSVSACRVAEQRHGELTLALRLPRASSNPADPTDPSQMESVSRARVAAYVGAQLDTRPGERLLRLIIPNGHRSNLAAIITLLKAHKENQLHTIL